MNEARRYKMFTETRGDVEVVLASDYDRDIEVLRCEKSQKQMCIDDLKRQLVEHERENAALQQQLVRMTDIANNPNDLLMDDLDFIAQVQNELATRAFQTQPTPPASVVEDE